jgi:large subunit ribosomal protein L24
MKNTDNKNLAKLPRIKKGDDVVVITGSNKGKSGRVLAVYPKTHRILVEGVAVAKRSYKKGAHPDLAEGGIHDKEMPIDISNVMLADPKTGAPTRIGIKVETQKDGSTARVRVAKSSGSVFKD